MSGINREKIFQELRNYHTYQLPDKIYNPEVIDLKNKFDIVEDRIIGMILSLVNGKNEFIDSTKELKSFHTKLESMNTSTRDEIGKNLFESKISKLGEIMILAKESGFQLKKIRGTKAIVKAR
jgi:hypothetical protein